MSTLLKENLGFGALASGKKWSVKIIEAGWGSSGYYGADMLKTFGPNVFKAGTKVYMNHPSVTEESDRPERDVNQLAGKLVSDAIFNGDGLYADIEFYSHFAPIIKEMANDVGLSIRAFGAAVNGEAEGRKGPIIESLEADPMTSVDVVTVAGAGGKFISLLESYKKQGEVAVVVTEAETEGNEMSISKEEFEAAVADLKTVFVEALGPLRESVQVLVEAATPAEEPETADEAAEETPELDPVDVAEKFNESGLPKIALKRIAEALKSGVTTKTVDELIEDEKAYADSLRESVAAPAAEVVGVVHEANKAATTVSDDYDSVIARLTGKN